MPKIDLPVKRLVQRRSYDWVRFLQPGRKKEWIKPFKSEYTPKMSSRLDEVFMIEDPGGAYLVNFEPMGYFDAVPCPCACCVTAATFGRQPCRTKREHRPFSRLCFSS